MGIEIHLDRVVCGLETEYCVAEDGPPRPHAAPRYLADRVVAALMHRVPHLPGAGGAWLGNGARVYVERGDHVEAATAEAACPEDLLAQDLALEALLAQAARDASGGGPQLVLLKADCDYSRPSVSAGCHESYLIRTDLGRLADLLIPHLVSRVVVCGAGRISPAAGGFELSQRAAVVDVAVGGDTTVHRAILCTRDEPLMGRKGPAAGMHRLHLVVGDANRSQLTTYLKAATTLLVLGAIQAGFLERDRAALALADPVATLRGFSADPWGRQAQPVGARLLRAVDVQQLYHARVGDYLAALDPAPAWAKAAWARWAEVLARLRADPLALAGQLDAYTKLHLFTRWLEERGKTWADVCADAALRARLCLLDVKYGQLGAGGLYTQLLAADAVETVVEARTIRRAEREAPVDTRAAVRGRLIRNLASAPGAGVRFAASWEVVADLDAGRQCDLGDPFVRGERWEPIPGRAPQPARPPETGSLPPCPARATDLPPEWTEWLRCVRALATGGRDGMPARFRPLEDEMLRLYSEGRMEVWRRPLCEFLRAHRLRIRLLTGLLPGRLDDRLAAAAQDAILAAGGASGVSPAATTGAAGERIAVYRWCAANAWSRPLSPEEELALARRWAERYRQAHVGWLTLHVLWLLNHEWPTCQRVIAGADEGPGIIGTGA